MRASMSTLGRMLVAFLFAVEATRALERLEPTDGCYFGVNPGDDDTPSGIRARLGLTPAVYVRFFSFPLTQDGRARLTAFLDEVRPTRGIALITLEPFQGDQRVSKWLLCAPRTKRRASVAFSSASRMR